MSLWRAVCTNGLIVSRGAFPAVYVPHRGNVVDEVVSGALRLAERFDILAAQVERMEGRHLAKDEQLHFAERALAIRFADPAHCGIVPSQLLTIRRSEDLGDDLYTVLNRTQQHYLACRRHPVLRSSPTRSRRLNTMPSIYSLNNCRFTSRLVIAATLTWNLFARKLIASSSSRSADVPGSGVRAF
jgi:Domain of unknown function (DUF932)